MSEKREGPRPHSECGRRAFQHYHGKRRRKKLLTLAGMIAEDENAVICDFAEIYHIFDYKALPVRLAATLAAGFGANSRSMQKALGVANPLPDSILLAAQADYLYNLQASSYTTHRFRCIVPPDILYHASLTSRYIRTFKVQCVHFPQRFLPVGRVRPLNTVCLSIVFQ